MVLGITGCNNSNGEKKLECTRSGNDTSIKDTFSFDDNDKMISAIRESTYSGEKYNLVVEQIDGAKEAAKEQGIDLKVTKNSDNVIVTQNYNGDKLNYFNNLVNGITEKSYEEIKSEYERVGATCK